MTGDTWSFLAFVAGGHHHGDHFLPRLFVFLLVSGVAYVVNSLSFLTVGDMLYGSAVRILRLPTTHRDLFQLADLKWLADFSTNSFASRFHSMAGGIFRTMTLIDELTNTDAVARPTE